MFTNFEEYAANSMLGHPDSPPRSDGKLYFSRAWERKIYGLAMAMAKEGHFEWEAFRQNLIETIAGWERAPCEGQPNWQYYECYLKAFEKVLSEHGILDVAELGLRIGE
ncbi:nitrile hydratase accessory protein [Paraburkholderia sp. GAS32]|jgi:nitrile hydratase accessory protein|uniref:nitrile hydratase accessory protein n=1 Tax=Paraburkholderia sp. GAS32 TaxID=3035129 RepID=UPI003D2256CD